jgi:hypothetical protein
VVTEREDLPLGLGAADSIALLLAVRSPIFGFLASKVASGIKCTLLNGKHSLALPVRSCTPSQKTDLRIFETMDIMDASDMYDKAPTLAIDEPRR